MDLYTSQTSCMDAYMKPHEVLELLSETSKFWSKKKNGSEKKNGSNRFFYSTVFHFFAESSSFMVKMASETIPVHQVLSIESYYIWEVPPKFKNLIFTAFFDIFLDFYRKSAETVLKALTGFTPPWHRQHFLLDFLIGSLDRRSSVHHSGKFCHQFKLSVTVFQRLLFFSENQFYRITFYTWTFHAFRN